MNQSQSRTPCHAVDGGKGGVDNQPPSGGLWEGRRNSPTVWNAGSIWPSPGTAGGNVEDQASPVLNPVEMAMPGTRIEMLERLECRSHSYVAAFKKAFPAMPLR